MYISRFETQISRFFPTHFPNHKVWEFQRLEGLQYIFNWQNVVLLGYLTLECL